MIRPDCAPDKVVLAVVRAIQATFDEGRWRELGLIVGKSKLIENHPRLLRSLRFGDDDYRSCVIEVVPKVLGRTTDEDGEPLFTNLTAVEDYLELQQPQRHLFLVEDELRPLFAELREVKNAVLAAQH